MTKTLHYHLHQADAGYLPWNEEEPYLEFSDAFAGLLDAAERYLDSTADAPDQSEAIRGQLHAAVPVTYADEVIEVERQVKVLQQMYDEHETREQMAAHGVRLVLEDGLSYIEVDVCTEAECLEGIDV